MSTQESKGVSFSICSEQQNFRLFELPPALLDLISSPNPPTLSIKSQETSPASGTAKPAYAVLCTPKQTYQLRQVQTSNSVFVTQPTTVQASEDHLPEPGVSAIASCTATLELHPVSESAVPFLRSALPLYHVSQGLENGSRRSKSEIFAHIPLSTGECELGWQELMAFEVGGHCHRPSPDTLAKLWRAIVAVTIAEDIDIASVFLASDIAKAVEEEGYPVPLVLSLLSSVASEDSDTSGKWVSIDKLKCLKFVGITTLEVKTRSTEGILTAEFIDAWRDLVPEAWRSEAQLELLKDTYILPSTTTIAYKNPGIDGSGIQVETSSGAGAAKRKWHEKFKKGRA